MTVGEATITGKRQITIPIEIFNILGLKQGDKLIVTSENDHFEVQSAVALVESLAGSVKIPKRFKKISTDKMIEVARKEHFAKKYGIR